MRVFLPSVPAQAKKLTAEELTKKLTNLLEEFLSVRDVKELFLSLEEFVTQAEDKAAVGPQLVEMGVKLILDKSNEKDGVRPQTHPASPSPLAVGPQLVEVGAKLVLDESNERSGV